MIIKKDFIGWSVFGKHYRLKSKYKVILFYFFDLFASFFFLLKKRKFNKSPKSILVIQLDHIGDMVLSSYFLSSLKKNFPDAKISVIIREMTEPVAELIPEIDEIICLNTPWLSRFKKISYLELLSFCLKKFKKYDLSFDVHGDPRNLIIAWALGKFSVGFGLRGFGFVLNKNVKWDKIYKKHIVDIQKMLLTSINLKTNGTFSIKFNTDIENNVNNILSRYKLKPQNFILIQMSSGASIKQLPKEYWLNLIKKLLKDNIVLTADQDSKTVSWISDNLQNKNFIHLKLQLPEYISIISLSKKVYSIDTFVIHVANGFKVPLFGFYSGTNLVNEWGPYNPLNTKIIQDKTCNLFPCGLKTCPFDHPSPCMKKIKLPY